MKTTPGEPTTDDGTPHHDAYSVPFHSAISGYADVIISTTVRFESIETMDAFCQWVSDQPSPPPVVRDFIHAAEDARNEGIRIRESFTA